jgi:hypothetical protein
MISQVELNTLYQVFRNLKVCIGSLYQKSCLVVELYHYVTNKEILLFHWSLLENPVISLVTLYSCDVVMNLDDKAGFSIYR